MIDNSRLALSDGPTVWKNTQLYIDNHIMLWESQLWMNLIDFLIYLRLTMSHWIETNPLTTNVWPFSTTHGNFHYNVYEKPSRKSFDS